MLEVIGSTPILSTKIKSCFGGIFDMDYYVYILYSPSINQYYVGHTQNIEDRIYRHKNSGSKSTKKANDWVVKYTEEFQSRQEASLRELAIKNKKSRKYIEWLVSSVG